MAGKASKPNLHRETLRAWLRIVNTAETLEQARIQLARMLNVFDKLEAQGVRGTRRCARPKSGRRSPRPRRPRAPTSGRSVGERRGGPARRESL
jgi:hypothetical protein